MKDSAVIVKVPSYFCPKCGNMLLWDWCMDEKRFQQWSKPCRCGTEFSLPPSIAIVQHRQSKLKE